LFYISISKVYLMILAWKNAVNIPGANKTNRNLWVKFFSKV